jgi:methylthioribose-1-phosphate isomerase
VAKYHNVPFHAVAPLSTVDFNCQCGDEIPIEQRNREEVHSRFFFMRRTLPFQKMKTVQMLIS